MPKVTKSYECDVCGKVYNTSKEAVVCEESHTDSSQCTIREKLAKIRETSKNFDELNQRAAKVLKAEYGDDFVIYVPSCNSFSSAQCTYVTAKKLKKNDPYRNSDMVVDASRILEELGFNTGCGSGDGKVYSYQSSSYKSQGSYPAMEAVAKERNLLVTEVNDKIKDLAKTSVDSLYQNEDFRFLDKEIEKLSEEILELEARRNGLQYQQDAIVGSISSALKTQTDKLILDLPKKTGCGVVELNVVRAIDVWADAKQRKNDAS